VLVAHLPPPREMMIARCCLFVPLMPMTSATFITLYMVIPDPATTPR